ncbi:NAD(P)-dependent oxidoreductase [Paenalkalicoccus suaedae]|uniref:NAD(P)-dependent oxidoreductase n=1 Tax=Paenalkalicoccus suaedae TaxID=2592382 RepID=A0A859FJE1_9BACI|nr:NAD(P)-dependent oxidoreductase [Paenalkalicoccus suaedae]QKS72865.1 NAD(P)-dependent oxidoreductase [Paenalkalicoccus suaedae]
MTKTIGFIGTGVMGASMAKHLLHAGYEVNVYTRTKSRADAVLEAGGKWYEDVKGVAQNSDVIITIVGYPQDVEEVYLGESGILAHAKEGSFTVDMTTSKPSLAKEIFEAARERNIHALDAPVSGGDVGAREAKLAIMIGGEEEAVEELRPIFEVLGQNVQHLGAAGLGQYTKMANQIAIASTMVGVSESLAYAKKAGLDPEQVIATISTGAAGSFSLSNLAPRMLKGDFAPGFYIKHFIKDMGIAIESAEEMGLDLPGLKQAKGLYDQLATNGEADSGTQALIKYYLQ